MTIKVGVPGTTVKRIAVADQTTTIKKVVVGTPVRRVNEVDRQLSALKDVDLNNLENGSLLIYKTTTSKWTASKDVEDEQNINGGSY